MSGSHLVSVLNSNSTNPIQTMKNDDLHSSELDRAMKPARFPRGWEFALKLGLAAVFALRGESYGNPSGMTVVSGSAVSSHQGNTLQIKTSPTAVLNWNSFNIAAGETTIFDQPSATSVVFNNIKGISPSTIYGSLQANGIVVLENQSGFYFGPNAFVKAGGLVVTTAALSSSSSPDGPMWTFNGPPSAVPIVNYGHLETPAGGSIFLIANQIANQGTVSAPGGTAALVAGQEVMISPRPNGLSLSAPVKLSSGSVDNEGNITADAGQILLQAQNVNNGGLLQANSVREQNGVIELVASGQVQLGANSSIQANGDSSSTSPGGTVAIKSGGTFSDSVGSQISTAGGANGGNGGNVEVSALNVLSLNSIINAAALPGWSVGTFLLDPAAIELGGTATGTISGATYYDVETAFQNITGNITLQATGNITLDTGTTWDLSVSTGKTTGQLTLQAGGNIALNNGSSIQDPNNWSISLAAGYSPSQGVISGTGNVTLTGTSTIQTASGNITVTAGSGVSVANGGIVTGIANGAVMGSGGGNVTVQALAGNVNCGDSVQGYNFSPVGDGYAVSPFLGGISTASGGNVTVTAGGNITAPLPTGTFSQANASDYGSGAFGSAPGNVTLTAGGNVTGHFVVANGVGTIIAGQNAGTTANNLALSLVDGGWTVNAANDIYLQDVRNPNGVFNGNDGSPTYLLFDYSPTASLTLNAGNAVFITGGNTATGGKSPGQTLPRYVTGEGLILPPIVAINAGAGGLTLYPNLPGGNVINLYPSPEGQLTINTTAGGWVNGNGNTINLSDATRNSFVQNSTFGPTDTEVNPLLHLNDPNRVMINLSGSSASGTFASEENLTLDSCKPAQIVVAGDIIDCAAKIQNLNPGDITTMSAGGQIVNYNSFVVVQLQAGDVPNFAALDQVINPTVLVPGGMIPNPDFNPTLALLSSRFYYSEASGTLLFAGAMSVAQERALLALHFLDLTDLNNIQAASQNDEPPAVAPGPIYEITGPGRFLVDASSISLGKGGGFISGGFGNSGGAAELATITPRGADLDITVSGDLDMDTATIESEYGGAINIKAGGSVDVGSPIATAYLAQNNFRNLTGIVSLWGGDINVVANGDINVDASRIAAYDGGNIFVESLQGNVLAGTGGEGSADFEKPYLNAEGQPSFLTEVIPGSGIIGTSFPKLLPGEAARIGNITVETPQGNIDAGQGGISQITLSPVAHNDATINLTAGTENANKTVAYLGDVNASGSGVVGGQVNIQATGSIIGLVVASLVPTSARCRT